jgi:hypothetical protein
MPDYWLDSAALIEPKNRGYAFDLVPGFWALVDQKLRDGVIAIPRKVYTEIVDDGSLPGGSKDALAQWLRARERFVHPEPDRTLQTSYREIADHVQATYIPKEANRFLSGADGWVIAHAVILGGKVVTFETLQAHKAKIPNVCQRFKVDFVDTWGMLRALGARFS